jgi:hypothetical protein
MQLEPLLPNKRHDDARSFLCDSLAKWLRDRERSAFVGRNVPIVTNGVTLIADVVVAVDADPRTRRAWITTIEGRPIDVVFRFVRGDRLAALVEAARHVELGARESFVFDRSDGSLWGFRRAHDKVDAIGPRADGAIRSAVLAVELIARGARLQVVPRAFDELFDVLDRLDRALDRVQRDVVTPLTPCEFGR